MRVSLFTFALLAEVKVRARTALVTDSLNWVSLASIASDALMKLRGLISSLFAKIVHHQSLESLSGV